MILRLILVLVFVLVLILIFALILILVHNNPPEPITTAQTVIKREIRFDLHTRNFHAAAACGGLKFSGLNCP